jgi:GNAT superfamily N-acetyltransferase
MIEILPFAPRHYPAITSLWNDAYPEMARTTAEWRLRDQQLSERLNKRRWVAEQGGEVVGFGGFQHDELMIDPHKFMVRIVVEPSWRRRGIGSALMEHLNRELRPFGAEVIRSWAREDRPAGIQFLRAHGLAEFHRVWMSQLDVSRFDFQPYDGYEEKLRSQAIEIRTLRELEGDADKERRLYELECELFADVVSPDPMVPLTYELFVETLRHNPKILPDAYFVAVQEGTYVGQSVLWANQADGGLDTGITGVRRDYRRRGAALALKLRGISYAREHGRTIIRTGNDSLNLPMLAINDRLGFVRQPAWILFSKALSAE